MDDSQGLDLFVIHRQTQLFNAAFDGVPSREARGEVHVSAHAEIGWVDDLVCGRVGEDCLLISQSAFCSMIKQGQLTTVPLRVCPPCGCFAGSQYGENLQSSRGHLKVRNLLNSS